MNNTDKYLDILKKEISIEEIESNIKEGSNLTKFIQSVKIYKEKNQKRFEQAYMLDEELKNEFKTFESFYELVIIRKIYNTLGKRFSFDLNFWFSGRKEKEKNYNRPIEEKDYEELFNTYVGNCKIIAKVMKKILKEINIECKEILDSHSVRNYAIHTMNVITPNDGSDKYIIDLENDLRDIQAKTRTRNFGFLYDIYEKSTNGKEVFKFSEIILEKIDILTNAISKQEYYSNEYSKFLEYYSKMFEGNIEDDATLDYIKVVIENLKPYDSKELKGRDRIVHHRRRLRHAFHAINIGTNPELFKYNKYQIYSIDGYYGKDKTNFGEYVIVVFKNKPIAFFYYKDEESKFVEISEEDYINAFVDDDFKTTINIPGLNHKIKETKRMKKIKTQSGEEQEV